MRSLAALLLLAACAAPNPLLEVLNRPTVLRSLNLEFGPNGNAEPIYEVTIHDASTTLPPARINLLPRRDDPIRSAMGRNDI